MPDRSAARGRPRWTQPSVALFAGLAAGAATADGLPAIVAGVRPAVVAIATLHKTRRPPLSLLGTGFAVGTGTQVITNAHVLPAQLDEARREELVIVTGRGESATVRPARLLRTDARHDLALLDIGAPALPPLTLGADDLSPEGTAIALTGFPIASVLGVYPVTHSGIVSAHTPIIAPADSARTLSADDIRFLRRPYEVYQLDATAYPGNSGSPVYDAATGDVIGVVNQVFVKGKKEDVLRDPSAITYAIPVRHVRALLDDATR